MAATKSDITSLLHEIQQKGGEFRAGDDRSRQALLASTQALVSLLESPVERVAKMCFHEPTLLSAVRVCVDLHLFEKMQEGGAGPKNVDQLAEMTGADSVLLARFLKHMATGGVVQETGPGEYAPNPISALFATAPASGALIDCFDNSAPIQAKLAEFFKSINYQTPTGKNRSTWTYGSGNEHYFKFITSPGNQKRAEAFRNHMKFKTFAKKWFETVSVPDLFAGFNKDDPEAVLMVDVGGNTGHDILNFHRAWPDLPGRLIVQDLPSFVSGIDKEVIKPAEALAHDFFTPQPIKGAKAYYLKMILHDWPDSSCQEILANLKPALEPGYSKILINEIVIPDRGADWFSTSVDMLMLLSHSAAERGEQQWRALIEGAGLKMTGLWDCEGAPEKLIEVELP